MSKKTNKIILVTGGAGFIGSAFVNILAPRYPTYTFVVLDALTPVADKRNITVLDRDNVTFVKGNICNARTLKNVFTTHQPTDIVHFAAETHVDVSIENPYLFVETNILGTKQLLAHARAYGINRFHHISTDEVYGSLTLADKPFTEDSPLRPNNPYSASKAAAEHLVRAYHKTFGLDTVITRCSNNYGPRQDATKFMPLFIARFIAGQSVPLYGRGQHIRDWLYVDDHIEALDLVFHKGKSGEVYNIGGNCEVHNRDAARILAQLVGQRKSLITFVADRPGHDLRYALNTKKIEKELGWKPAVSFADGVAKTIAFYKEKPQRTRPNKR